MAQASNDTKTAPAEEAQAFDAFYTAYARSKTLQAIFRDACEMGELPEEIAPYSFISASDLNRICGLLSLAAGERLADLGCGAGGIGLWLARQTGARLSGVDISAAAVALAMKKAARLGLNNLSEFAIGSFENSGFQPQSFDAVVSIDALWLAPDQRRALDEAARILRPGARLVFTSWEQHIPMPFVKDPVKDYRPLLGSAGFEISLYEYLPHSEPLMMAIYERVRSAQTTLIQEMGDAVRGFIGEAYFVPGLIDGVNYISKENGPHVLVCATRG